MCALAIGLTAGLANADIEGGLTGYWSFEEGTGDTTADVSGNGNDGTLTNGPTWGDGPAGLSGALDFDGNDDYVECQSLASTTTGQLSISLWVNYERKGADPGRAALVANRTEDRSDMMFELIIRNLGIPAGGEVYNRLMITQGVTSWPSNWCAWKDEEGVPKVEVPQNEWTHIVVTCDGSEATAYLNSELIATAEWILPPANVCPLFIGWSTRRDGGTGPPLEHFYGLIDDVRLYDRLLSADDIQELYEFRSDPGYNAQPKIDAGDYQSLLWPDNTVQLDATASDDGKPLTDPCDPCSPSIGLTLTWSQLSGPGNVTFDPCNAVEDPIATFTAAGMYELQLCGYDGEKDACDIVNIYIRPANNMVAHWDFETGSGTNVVDRTVNNNFGTFSSDPEPNWVAGWIGNWAIEVGNNSHVEITTDPAADPNLDVMEYEVSVAAWVKVDSWPATAWTGIVTKGHDHDDVEGDGGWQLIRNHLGDSLIFHAANAGLVYGSEIVGDGYWHHVAGVHNGTTISLYVDGLLDTSEAAYGLVKPNTDDIWINGNSDELRRFFNGEIDDVRVYDYGLSAAEITDLAAMGALIPRVDAGVDQTFLFSTQNNYLQLDATVTDDGNPEAATLEWTSDPCNPGTVVFSNTAIEDPCAIFSTAGTYILRLTADDTMAQIYDEVTIEAENPTCLNVIDDGLLIIGDISGSDGTPDCYVNLYDFAELTGYWLRCNNPQDLECEFPY